MAKKKLKEFKDIKSKLRTAYFQKGVIGADPELFIKRNGHTIGSEKVITETDNVVEDGVQVELHPRAHYCRESLAHYVANCLVELRSMMSGKKCSVTSDVLVDVSKTQYDSLKDKNKQFGCGRSYNAYKESVELLNLDPAKYLKRSAGGHMHFGKVGLSNKAKKILTTPKKIVPIMDILVGNTAVLLDRDEGNKERRKYYGLAGEFRLPPHGLEYRTLSNFWLRGEPLMSLMFGLARHSIGVCEHDMDKHLLSLVDIDDIIKAINTNDYELAKKNWDKYKEFIVATASKFSSWYPIRNMDDVKFLERVADEGIDKWFSKDIFENWLGDDYNIRCGWTSFKQKQERKAEQERAECIADTTIARCTEAVTQGTTTSVGQAYR